MPQRGQRVVDRVAALHADHRADAAALEGALGGVGGERQLEGLRPPLRHAVDDVNLFEGGADGVLALHLGRHVDRPELRAEPAATEARNVGHQRRHRLGDVGLVEVAADVPLAQGPGIVVVAVDDRRLLVQRAGTGQQIVLGIGREDGRDGDGQPQGPGGKPGISHGAIRPRQRAGAHCFRATCACLGTIGSHRRQVRSVGHNRVETSGTCVCNLSRPIANGLTDAATPWLFPNARTVSA